MRFTQLLRLFAGMALVATVAACGDEEPMMAMENAMTPAPCVVDPGDFALNSETMSKTGLYAVRIVDAMPAPPRKNVNLWTVEFVKPGGGVVQDATIDKVEPFMPAHGHNGIYDPVITPMDNGQFEVDVINLWMGGGWQVKFDVTVDGQSDQAVVEVCVPG